MLSIVVYSDILQIFGALEHRTQRRRQNFAPGGTGAWRTGSEVRGDKVIQK